ncbi:MAG TPA: PIG-L family deacetylase [bacterium]|jgi:LmbE family N-acetylglucosaminyl deacetylase|nr:PIG-L family deacetylase [bacterium]
MKVSVIIPALDEAHTVGQVVDAAKRAPSVSEVIVVSDGSRDATAEAARQAGADLVIELSKTVGKGGAVMAGVDLAHGEAIVFLDADLIGLQSEHIETLVQPILRNEADMVVGLLGEDLLQMVAPYLAGQRALSRSLLLRAPDLRHRGFALEHTLSRAARRQKWRVRSVDLEGVSHRSKAKKYGLVRGYRFKLQATRDHLVSRKRQPRRLFGWGRGATGVVIVLIAYGVAGLFIPNTFAGHLDAMRPPTAADRILLVVAHNDDEIIAAGGYLSSAVAAGSQVTVVVVTNGDGNKFSAAVLSRRVRPGPREYIREGEVRQQESLSALQRLGIAPAQVVFLGLPDRGMNDLLTVHWSRLAPYVSPFTRTSAPPYSGAYRPKMQYAGEDVHAILAEITERAAPTIVLFHSDLDEHADHQALNAFVTMVLDDLAQRSPAIRPRRYTFVIHATDYPRPLRYSPKSALLPPPHIRVDGRWVRFDLTPAQVAAKTNAMHAYRSQYQSPYLRLLLNSFIRRNELFIEETESPLR